MALKGPNSGAVSPADQVGSPMDYTHGGALDTMQPMTVAFWARYGSRSQVISNGHDSAIMSKSNGLFPGTGWTIYTFVDTGTPYIEFDAQGWTGTNGNFSNWVSFPDSNWHHCVFTYAYTTWSDVPIFYMDGIAQTIFAPFSGLPDNGATVVPGDTNNLRIGDYYYNTRGWQGSLAGVSIWNDVLSADEAMRLAKGEDPAKIRRHKLQFCPDQFRDVAHAIDAGLAHIGVPHSITGAWALDQNPPQLKPKSAPILRRISPPTGAAALSITSSATISAFTQTAPMKLIGKIASSATMGAFANSAALKLIGKIVSSATMGAFTQTATLQHGGSLTSSATIAAFTQTVPMKLIGKIASSATMAAFTQTAPMKALAKITSSATMDAFVQVATLLRARQVASAATMGAFIQNAAISTGNPAPTGSFYPIPARRRGRR